MAIPIKTVLSVSTRTFTKGFGLATKALGGFVSVAKSAAIAIAGLTAVTVAFTLRQAALIDRLGKVSAVTGVGTDLLQKFGFAAEQAGVSTDQAQVALRRFSRRLGEAQKGTGELLPALRRLRIATKNSDGSFKSAEQVLLEFADAISQIEDPSQRLALAFKAFDSEGAELVKTLEEGADGLQEFFDQAQAFGLVLDRDAIQGVEDFNDSLNKLVRTIDAQAKRVIAEFAPDLQRLADTIAENIRLAAQAAGGFDRLAVIIRNKVLDVLIKIVETAEKVSNIFLFLGQAIISLATTLGAPGTELNNLKNSLKDFQDLIGKPLIDRLTTLNITSGRTAEILEEKLGKSFLLTKDNIAIAIAAIEEEIKRLEESGAVDIGQMLGTADFSDLIEDLQNLKKVLDPLPDSVDEIVTTAQKLDLNLFDRIRIFFEDLPEKMRESIKSIGSVLDSARDKLVEMNDPIKTLEDGLVKAGKSFEDALVNAILTGKANFEDFRNLLRETLARAMVQKFITGPTGIFGILGLAKGGLARAGTPYIVGEEGPELFVPGTSGTVIPHNQTMAMAAGGGATTSVTYNIQAIDTASFEERLARDPEFIYAVTEAGRRRSPGGRL